MENVGSDSNTQSTTQVCRISECRRGKCRLQDINLSDAKYATIHGWIRHWVKRFGFRGTFPIEDAESYCWLAVVKVLRSYDSNHSSGATWKTMVTAAIKNACITRYNKRKAENGLVQRELHEGHLEGLKTRDIASEFGKDEISSWREASFHSVINLLPNADRIMFHGRLKGLYWRECGDKDPGTLRARFESWIEYLKPLLYTIHEGDKHGFKRMFPLYQHSIEKKYGMSTRESCKNLATQANT